MNKTRLSCFSNILDSPDNLRGVLSDHRIEEIKSWVAPESFQEVKLENGREISSHLINIYTQGLWDKKNWDRESSVDYISREIINELLTEEEIALINEKACRVYSERREQELFEKAEKIKAANWDGWVFCDGASYNDGYFPNIDEFLEWENEWFQENNPDEENFEPIKGTYILNT